MFGFVLSYDKAGHDNKLLYVTELISKKEKKNRFLHVLQHTMHGVRKIVKLCSFFSAN